MSAGSVNQPRPKVPTQQSGSAEEIEQRKKMEQRARRFAALPPAKSQVVAGVAKLGTKRPSDQGLEADGQSAAKQMRLLASRKVVAKAKATATVVQQRQNLMPQSQQLQLAQLKPVAPQTTRQSSASTMQQQGAVQRIPASQRLGTVTKSVQQHQQQPVSGSQKTTPASAPRPTRPISDVSYICTDVVVVSL